MYLNSETTCHIKLKFFLWIYLLKNLLLAKYLISVAVPLSLCTPLAEVDSKGIKTILHATIPLLLSNIVWSTPRTAQNSEETDHIDRKYFQLTIFHNFEHFYFPALIAKQNKSNWARNYIWHPYHFIKFLHNFPEIHHNLRLHLPKILRKQNTTVENCWK